MIKKTLFILIFLLAANTWANEATNLTSTRPEIRNLFNDLWSKFKGYDGNHCYRRAHVLAYQMAQQNINSMKVFFFKGDKLKLPFSWYYHVAPMIYHNGKPVV